MPVATKRPLPSFSRSTPNLPTLQSQRDVVEQDITPRATARQTYNVPSPTTIQEDEDGEDIEEDDDDDDDDDFPSHYSLDARSSSDASDDDDDNDDVSDDGQQDARQGPFMHRSNSSFLNVFAPPFYNRPPTPRLTTPSLTSLLRPSFSAAPSRPTTPDSSENDTPNDTEAAVAKSARTAPTVPRASPKVPTYEYYGFVLYLVSSLCFRGSSSACGKSVTNGDSHVSIVVLFAVAVFASTWNLLLSESMVVTCDSCLSRDDHSVYLRSASLLQHRISHLTNEQHREHCG